MKTEILLREIERLRELMHKMALHKGVSHPEVLQISQQLDQILNEYSTMIVDQRGLLATVKNEIF